MMENNSFDRMLGALFPERSGGGGIKGTAGNHFNIDPQTHSPIYLKATSTREVQLDPGHNLDNTLIQIKGPNKGFVEDFVTKYSNSRSQDRQEIMGYYPDGALPVLHRLAKSFTVCDAWFSSLPGPTWPNRVFVHTGTSLGYTTNSILNVWDQTTLYQLLDARGISYKIYYGDLSQTYALIHKPQVDAMKYFFRDVQGPETSFPKYCFIEPHYGTISPSGQNDQHPPSDVFRGEKLIADVYNALRANDPLWQRSLLIVTYDEHGGFYDHVYPPPTVAPDNRTDPHFDFKQLGVRVPTILISPWVAPGVITDIFDHTSLLKFLIDKWGLRDDLGYRAAAASPTNTFKRYILRGPRRIPENLRRLNVPSVLPPRDAGELTDYQETLLDLSRELASEIGESDVRLPLMRQPAEATTTSRRQLAAEQFDAFLLDRAKAAATSWSTPAKTGRTGIAAARRRRRTAKKRSRR
jgi:phospholipase C